MVETIQTLGRKSTYVIINQLAHTNTKIVKSYNQYPELIFIIGILRGSDTNGLRRPLTKKNCVRMGIRIRPLIGSKLICGSPFWR